MTTKKRPIAIAAVLCLLLLAGVLVFLKSTTSTQSADSTSSDKLGGGTPSGDLTQNPPSGDQAEKPGSPAPSRLDNTATDTPRTKLRDRSAPLDRSKLPITDVSKNIIEQSAWPDGPRLFAEFSTESKKFTNLRPNSIGVMPRIQVTAGESLELKLEAPGSAENDILYVELTDGGTFTDTPDLRGRRISLGANLTAEIPLTADLRDGYFNIVIRQAGHSRTLPVWVGALPEIAADGAGQ